MSRLSLTCMLLVALLVSAGGVQAATVLGQGEDCSSDAQMREDCVKSVYPETATIPYTGGTYYIDVTTNNDWCSWRIEGGNSWLTRPQNG